MASLKINIAANLIGKIWAAIIAIVLIPQYIKFLGIESYGLVGFYGTLIGSIAILDFGLSTTINRELAKYKSENRPVKDIRDLTFSLESVYWAIGIFICLLVLAFSWLIATRWVRAEDIPLSTVRQSVMLMGIMLAFQWPISLYEGGLTGLNRQVLNNVIAVTVATFKAVGVIIILKYFSPTLQAFFLWQAALSFLQVFILRWALWKAMPEYPEKPRFSKQQLKIVWRFAAGMTGISLITFFLTQVDKIVLTKILPLSQFGYYTLAFTIATSIRLVVLPVSLAFFPRFSHLVAAGKQEELKNLYHLASKVMAAFIFPTCLVLLFFMRDILSIWTKNETTTEQTYLMAQVLVAGTMLNSIMVIPYNLIIANGWTRFTIYQNTIAVIVLVPMLFLWTNWYGALGATFVWLAVNAGCFLISIPLMHRRLLKNELRNWYWKDTILPLLSPLLIVILIKSFLKIFSPEFELTLIMLGFVFIFAFAGSLLSIPQARQFVITRFLNKLA